MSELQHPQSRAFELVADVYERARPEYPPEAIAWLAEKLELGPGREALDLGAGTGKLTRALVGVGADVIAVEPGPEMLARLRNAVPEVEALLGAAEDIPLADDSVDAVLCAQSFHWFRAEVALSEIRRVLRPGGGLGLIWNVRAPDDPLQNEVTTLLEPFVPPGRTALPTTVANFVAKTFGGIEKHIVGFEQELDADALVARVSSISFVAAASPSAQRDLETALRTLAAAQGERFAFRYLTEAYVTFPGE